VIGPRRITGNDSTHSQLLPRTFGNTLKRYNGRVRFVARGRASAAWASARTQASFAITPTLAPLGGTADRECTRAAKPFSRLTLRVTGRSVFPYSRGISRGAALRSPWGGHRETDALPAFVRRQPTSTDRCPSCGARAHLLPRLPDLRATL